ncbi:tRNA (adenosine(37)-N6)-threonylcarbamoyltransferase complex ATPase subunit type 1 TsaE [Galbibacter pacificus]|uniref:tRNA threonylcarbamoyladenosine biosynthesis protein TsaE n=1 Tax=Galbibacter pacificus TaxID=2996052 RepID=A0ABT6FQ04_9FLAO|nr:tRNA (adenosine(37)-N6)-threonylcarbamoyltransferase complex ATPase subunit type 1 TsaE [Galbibacter pacificus]MDG3582229.1 tRNA (adenosine(37)-N6)-threonylcarbamoyltransferase complex ATPase subunit type 1 TsaE [Galbibacter pacificus]MDG3585295.1 tRNA (adenosine(37)-N6)-threonylcarbamoyltransferase complex ATPase subunit type 1 TsaE [Galbibacter pacificus]
MLEAEYSLSDITAIAKKIIDNSQSKILLFNGEMGVGKTTLIKEIVKELGSKDNVSSPTFSIVNEYEGEEGPIYHFDFYRINNIEEVYNIGLDYYLHEQAWCLIEWPEKIAELLPNEVTIIDIKTQLNGKRTVNLK